MVLSKCLPSDTHPVQKIIRIYLIDSPWLPFGSESLGDRGLSTIYIWREKEYLKSKIIKQISFWEEPLLRNFSVKWG